MYQRYRSMPLLAPLFSLLWHRDLKYKIVWHLLKKISQYPIAKQTQMIISKIKLYMHRFQNQYQPSNFVVSVKTRLLVITHIYKRWSIDQTISTTATWGRLIKSVLTWQRNKWFHRLWSNRKLKEISLMDKSSNRPQQQFSWITLQSGWKRCRNFWRLKKKGKTSLQIKIGQRSPKLLSHQGKTMLL